MIDDWIYNNPTWLWGTILVAVVTTASCVGLLVFHRLVHVSLRKAHNDLAGFTIAIISVLYAVLLAFIAIATWESFSRASDIVENESDFAGGIYFDTQGLPQAKGKEIRDAVVRYVSVVIDDEWPVQRAGKTPNQGWKPLRELNGAIATIHPQNLGEAMIEAELLKTWNELTWRAAAASLLSKAYSGRDLVDHLLWWGNHYRLHLFLRLRKLRHAYGDDSHSCGHACAGRSADNRT
jgi:hypothetical protein